MSRVLVGYDECRCILTQYCDGECRPVFADRSSRYGVAPTQGADAPSPELLALAQRVLDQPEDTDTPEQWAGKVADSIYGTQGADTRPVAIPESERKAIAKSVFGGINALRWILNITTEFDRKDVRTRQAARLLDDHCTGDGTTNRAHLEHLWKTLNDALSLKDTLECLATRDAVLSDVQDAQRLDFADSNAVNWVPGSGLYFTPRGKFLPTVVKAENFREAIDKAIAASAPRDKS